MLHRNTLLRALGKLGVLAIAGWCMSCTDPVRDKQISDLGDEPGDVPQGPLHRPGQPCVVCHSDGGPASDMKFAVAGTIFETADKDAMGANEVTVLFIDASSNQRQTVTNEAGNFYIPDGDWPDLTYPFKVGIVKANTPVQMHSTINREPSCNFCHEPTPGSPHSYLGNDTRESIGQIYVTAQAVTP
jgi:hypothetical protein